MTTPFERTRSLIRTRELLKSLQDPWETPRVPKWLRDEARVLLRHFPDDSSIELASKALPHLVGPVACFGRASSTDEVQGVVAVSAASGGGASEPKTDASKAPKAGA